MASPQSRCWQPAAFQAPALGRGNAPAFVPKAGTEPSRAEGGPASSLTIGSALPAPTQTPRQGPRCDTGLLVMPSPPPWHADALPACSHISSPDVGKGHRSQYRRVSWHWHNWELTGYFPVLLQAHLKMFPNKRAKNSLRLPVRSLPGPRSIPTRVPSNTRQASSTRPGDTGKQDQEPLKRHVTGTAQKARDLPSLAKRR